MSTVASELADGAHVPTASRPDVEVVRVGDAYHAIEAAVILGEQRAWLEQRLGRSLDEAHPTSRDEYAHPDVYYRAPDALFVGRVDGYPAGVVAACRLDPRVVELRRLYVRPVGRGFGLGRLLSNAVIDHSRRIGAQRVRLDTSRILMPDAVRLYRALGFRDVAPVDYADVPGITGMELTL